MSLHAQGSRLTSAHDTSGRLLPGRQRRCIPHRAHLGGYQRRLSYPQALRTRLPPGTAGCHRQIHRRRAPLVPAWAAPGWGRAAPARAKPGAASPGLGALALAKAPLGELGVGLAPELAWVTLSRAVEVLQRTGHILRLAEAKEPERLITTSLPYSLKVIIPHWFFSSRLYYVTGICRIPAGPLALDPENLSFLTAAGG